MIVFWKKYLVIAVAMNVWHATLAACPELYQRYSEKHTFCLPANTSCKIIANTVTPAQSEEIVRLHNLYRSRIAMGQENIGKLPPATDMIQMEWNDELAAVAQKHANQCKYAHDCNECRETENFEAGQNLFIHWSTGSNSLRMNWKAAIELWYDEVQYFNQGIINSYDASKGTGPIGHFTQEIWSRTWKVGCGYVAYKNMGTTYEMHTCNYGPAGNVYQDFVYKTGPACSNCPGNTCCGPACSNRPNYPGLCQVLPGKIPAYFRPSGYNYFCDFSDPNKCNVVTQPGMKEWKIVKTLSGNHLTIVLNGGESSLFKVTTPFKSQSTTCLVIVYKKGPNNAAQGGSNEAKELFQLPGYEVQQPLADSKIDMTFSMNLDFSQDFKFSVSFSVPRGSAAQYFEVKEIYSKSGRCNN